MSHFTCKAMRTILFSAAAVMVMAGAASASEGNLAVGVAQATGDGLRMREWPTTESTIVYKMEKGTTIALLDNDEDMDGWYRVSYNGKVGYVSADYVQQLNSASFQTYAQVNGERVPVQAEPTDESDTLELIADKAYVTVSSLQDGWYAVKCKYGTVGYIRSDYLELTDNDGTQTAQTTKSSNGAAVAAYARKFKGYRYVYGAAGPSRFDCSGLTMYVYKQFGVSLPHSASSQWLNGTGTRVYKMANLQPGDLIFFNNPRYNRGKACSHVGLYLGDGMMIHASSSKTGVIISSIYSGSYPKYFVGGKHIL